MEKLEAIHKDDASLNGTLTISPTNYQIKTTSSGIELFPQPSNNPQDPLV